MQWTYCNSRTFQTRRRYDVAVIYLRIEDKNAVLRAMRSDGYAQLRNFVKSQ